MWVTFLFVFTACFALLVYGIVSSYRRHVAPGVLISLAISLGLAAFGASHFHAGLRDFNRWKIEELPFRLLMCFNFLSTYGFKVEWSPRYLSRGQRLAWELGKWALIATYITMVFSAEWAIWATLFLYGELAYLRGIKRATLGARMFEFPRLHGALITGTGVSALAVALVSLAACCFAGFWKLTLFPALLATLGYSLWRNAGRLVVRENGLEGEGLLLRWNLVDRFDWFEENGTPVLRIVCRAGSEQDEQRDIRFASPQIPQVDMIFAEHGVKAM